jgi:hypothetical protein
MDGGCCPLKALAATDNRQSILNMAAATSTVPVTVTVTVTVTARQCHRLRYQHQHHSDSRFAAARLAVGKHRGCTGKQQQQARDGK